MNNKTQFVRVEKNKNYTTINNAFLRRKDLSWKAKGILTYILSLPNDWNINLNEIMTHSADGEGSFRSGWKELQTAGYVKRYPIKDEETKRILKWETVVYESVELATSDPDSKKPHVENPQVDKPHMDKQHVENHKLPSTYITNNLSIPSTNKDSRNSANAKYADDSPFLKLAELLFERIKTRNPKHKKPNLQSWADDVRKTIELDDRTNDEYLQVLEWSQRDLFWQTNILSPAKLRKQFDTLTLQMQSDLNKRNGFKPTVVPQQTKIHEHVISDADKEAFERLQREGF